MRKTSVFLIFTVFLGLFGCAPTTRTQQGSLYGTGIGAGLGAIAGQAIGRDTKGTLIGAGIGAALGGVTGNRIGAYMDQQEAALRQAMAASHSASVQRSREVLTATFNSEVLFDHDSFVLRPGGYNEIDRVARVLNQYPDTTIRVEGYTDASGREDYNLRLSERRAQSVKNALIQRGVSPDRIAAIGFGESRSLSSNPAANRRVNIVISPDHQRYAGMGSW